MINPNQQLNNTSSVPSIFKDNPHLSYIYRKSERLISALYLLSNFISDNEPVKWQIRDTGLNLIDLGLSIGPGSSKSLINDFNVEVLKLISYLEIAYVSGLISQMNHNVLKQELESLIKSLDSNGQDSSSGNILFPENFFNVPNVSTPKIPEESKGHNTMSDRMSFKKPTPKPREKSNRQEVILALLKKNKELGIKDFMGSISDCSEKTIQRELATLVNKGIVRKEGEKRWSRYMLKM